jgi:hypothetical protein
MVLATTIQIFRLIHIDNLQVCLSRGGMHAPNHAPIDGLVYKTIHNIDIQRERQIRNIPCGAKGTIHDYVPFYFGPLSPMLLQLHTGYVDGYNEGQEPLIYIVTTVQAVIKSEIPYVFSDGHGIATFTEWYDSPTNLGKIDWDVVGERYWKDTIDDPDKQRKKQAEFLIYKFCPWNLVREVGVYDGNTKISVDSILSKYGKNTPVQVRRQWYY